jgi:hypothetical protein
MLDEIAAEDHVPPVEGVGGLEEEALVAIVVHRRPPTGVSFSVGAAPSSYRPQSMRPGVEIDCRG